MDLSAFRADFPILERRAYLYSGGLAPGSRRVGGALTDWIGRWTSDPIDFRARYTDDIDAVRESLATLLGGAPSGYAVVDSTSRASNLAVALLDAPEGANVIADDTTYSSSLLPWYLRGVEVRIARGRSVSDRIGEIHALIDGHTIAITISHVAHTSGYRHDLVTLADLAHNAGVRLIVDVAQSAGAFPLDLGACGVDLAAGVSMKWLLGPPGLGFLYAASDLADRLPPHAGHFGSRLTGDRVQHRPGGRRHEIGVPNLLGMAGFRAGLSLLSEVGISDISRRIEELVTHTIVRLGGLGYEVLTPFDRSHRAGIIALRTDRPAAIAAFLRERGVDVWGTDRDRRLRIDPHGFNDETDIERLVAAMGAWRRTHKEA